jgi:hypothetical protein
MHNTTVEPSKTIVTPSKESVLSTVTVAMGETIFLCNWASRGPFVHPPDDEGIWSSGGMMLTGEKQRTQKEICISATLSSTNPTWTDLGVNPGLNGEKLLTNHLSYGMACPGHVHEGSHHVS